MDYIKLLTDCLTEMYNSQDRYKPIEYWKPMFKVTDTNDVEAILEKFVADRYAIKNGREYQISVDGRLFVEYGGYLQRKVDQDLDRDYKERVNQEGRNNSSRQLKIQLSQVRAMTMLNRLTWAVAVATGIAALYYLIEIIKFFAPACAGR